MLLNVLRCRLTYLGQAETSAEAWFNIALRPRKPEGSLGRTAQYGHLDSHTAPELCPGDDDEVGLHVLGCRVDILGSPGDVKSWAFVAERIVLLLSCSRGQLLFEHCLRDSAPHSCRNSNQRSTQVAWHRTGRSPPP